eukprot:SAG25_NODE_655_length_6126_cov_12.125270_4_plen_199_part_00
MEPHKERLHQDLMCGRIAQEYWHGPIGHSACKSTQSEHADTLREMVAESDLMAKETPEGETKREEIFAEYGAIAVVQREEKREESAARRAVKERTPMPNDAMGRQLAQSRHARLVHRKAARAERVATMREQSPLPTELIPTNHQHTRLCKCVCMWHLFHPYYCMRMYFPASILLLNAVWGADMPTPWRESTTNSQRMC